MIIEIVKRLQEVGYYQPNASEVRNGKRKSGKPINGVYIHDPKDISDNPKKYYVPTFDEIVEALWEKIYPNQISLYGRDKDRWEVAVVYLEIFNAPIIPHKISYGCSPLEALANLYIKIYENK